MGYATPDTEAPGRKSYRITPQGKAFLVANRAAADEVLWRTGSSGPGAMPACLIRSLEIFDRAVRRRQGRGPISPDCAAGIAAAVAAAATALDRDG